MLYGLGVSYGYNAMDHGLGTWTTCELSGIQPRSDILKFLVILARYAIGNRRKDRLNESSRLVRRERQNYSQLEMSGSGSGSGSGAELGLLLPAGSLFNLNLTVINFLFSISSSSSSRIGSPGPLNIGFTRHRLTMARFAPYPQNQLKIWIGIWFGPDI